MKFILFVEGYTEDIALPRFLKRWLDPQLSHPVGIKTVRFEGWPQLVKDAPLKAKMHLNGPDKTDIIAIISLLDLYGPNFYPDHCSSAEQRYDWAKKDIEAQVQQARFHQFFAVHEVEAWLLSSPQIFPSAIARALEKKNRPPESINSVEPPAKLLEKLYASHTGRSYKKIAHGKELFDKLNPDIAYQKCPKLQQLLDHMLTLAKQFA
ncbi:MAG: hypothetical protein RL748_4568 [Pseudomonadota bacterium]|jgi:hypothetical protein